MRMLENEEYYLEQIRKYLKEQGRPFAMVVTVKQAMEILQVKTRKSIYDKFTVNNGKIQIAEVAKHLCKMGKCKGIA